MIIEEKVKKNFGFGLMRLPMMNENEVDIEQVKVMVDKFIASGFNYFDTAHGYLNGLSEKAFKEAVSNRYDRSEYILTDKLSVWMFNTEEEMRKTFDDELESCGVDYFDFLLVHSQNKSLYPKCKELHVYEFAQEMKEKGKVKHVGFSFHDTPEYLDMILNEHPEIEIVQIQFNYLDYNSDNVQSRKLYEVIRKHNKPIIVMEPVRGGALSSLDEDCGKIIDLVNYTPASYAVKFAASFEGVEMVLSGMSNIQQMEDNINSFTNFKPYNEEEKNKLLEVGELILKLNKIPCTKCKYCVPECKQGINIPEIFECLNDKKIYKAWWAIKKYNELIKNGSGKASDCLKCGKCEKVCPQHIHIRELLEESKKYFEEQ